MLSQKALLDQLMGKDRNLTKEESHMVKVHWSDQKFCRSFLCGFCPNQLLINTKSSIGPCDLQHDEAMQEEYVYRCEYL